MTQESESERDTPQAVIPDGVHGDLLSSVTDVVISVDGTGTIQTLADHGEQTLGYQPDHLAGESLSSLFAADTPPSPLFDVRSVEEFENAVADDDMSTVTAPLETVDGRVVTLSLRRSTTPDRSGPIFLGQDLSDQVSRVQNQQSQEVFNSIADPLYVLDVEGRFEQVNDALVAYTGYERAELLGREIGEILTVDGHTATELIEHGEVGTETVEVTVLTKWGERIMTEANLASLTDDGEYAGSVGVLRDIRERKHRERNLDLLKQVLARVFRHNVRNELMVVAGNAELLQARVDDDLGEHTEKILETADHLLGHSEKARLIEQVIETHELVEVDLTETVSTVLEAMREEYPEATIDVELPETAAVDAHPDVPKAIRELLENAIEHAPDGSEPYVDIWLDQQDGTKTLFVEDESGGLANHEITVLEREEESDLEHSSGVGLWLIRWLVEYSDAEMIVHRTAEGSLMGIRFGQQADASPTDDISSPLTRTPAHVRDISPERFRGDTVIGRVEILDQLEEIYDSLERTGGHSVLVTGEAGIGKTTLIEQFRDRVATSVIGSGACESGAQPAYHAFREVMEDLPSERDIAEILTDAADLSAEDADDLQQRKRGLFADIADELRALAAEQSVVLLVEDMQWADQGTIELFAYLVEEVGRWGHPVLFLGTYRTSDVDRSHPVLEIANETADAGRGSVLELEPFGQDEVDSLLSYMLDVEELPASFVEAVYDHTGGTPLFVNELGRHFVETLGPIQSGTDLPESLEEVAVPETVESAITERLDALPEGVRPVVRLGAVIGSEFSLDLLWEASGRSIEILIEASNSLIRRQIWTRSDEGIKFVHGVVREQALAAVPDADRDRLHETVASAIETVHEDSLGEYASQLGYHYEQIGEHDTAFEYYRQAGEHASDAYANEDAIEQYERALSLADEHGVAEEIATVRSAVGERYRQLGEFDEAAEHFERSLDISQETGDREGTAESLYNLGRVSRQRDEYDTAGQFIERSLDIFRELDDREGEASALAVRGRVAFSRGNYDQAQEYLEGSLTISREIGDRQGEANSLDSLARLLIQRGNHDKAQKYCEESLATYRELGDRHRKGAVLNQLGLIAFRRDDYEQGREYYERSLELRREIGDRYGEAHCLHNLGFVAYRRNSYDRAREYYEQSLRISQEIESRHNEALSLVNLVLIAFHRGNYDQVREYAQQSLEINREINNARGEALSLVGLGLHANISGEFERAREHLTDALEMGREMGIVVPELMSLRELGAVARKQEAYEQAATHLAESLAACDEDEYKYERANTHLERTRLALARDDIETARAAVQQADRIFAELEATHHEALATLLEGRLAAAIDRPDQARQHWRNALETFEDVDAPRDALETLQYLVETCREQGDDEQANEYRERARTVFENAPEPVRTNHGGWLDALPE